MTTSFDLSPFIRDVPDFPRAGILFKDITPLLQNPDAFATSVRGLAGAYQARTGSSKPEAVVAIESRGFVFGAALALEWRVPFVPARKFGKLPGRTVRQVYSLEYGEDSLEIHADALTAGQRVAIVDDLLATGGTAAATVALVEQVGGRVDALLFLIELAGLGGRDKLAPHPVEALLTFEV